jgi:hypothetical protein
MTNGKSSAAKKNDMSTDEEQRLDFFITTPLRSAKKLMDQLYADDSFYQTTQYAWVGEDDAKKIFLYGVCKEVMKMCTGLIADKELLSDIPDTKEPDQTHKIVMGSIIDVQSYRTRKLIELLSLLILFDRNTKNNEEYRIFLSAENLDLSLSQLEDFRGMHEGLIISNTKHSVDDFAGRIKNDLDKLSLSEIWFLDINKLNKLKPSVFKSKKSLYLDSLLVANADESLMLGVSYGRGYSKNSRSVHPTIGSHDYGVRENDYRHVTGNFSHLSMLGMHLMNLAYKLAGISDEEGLSQIMGDNFEKSEASKTIANLEKKIEINALVLTQWGDLAEILDSHTSKYGYTAYRIKYLSRPPIPEFPEDWIEAASITTSLVSKNTVRAFYEKNVNPEKVPEIVADIWPDVMAQSDDKLLESAKATFVQLHEIKALIPMLLESGFLKK